MIFGNRVAQMKLVEQLTLITLQTAHHGSTSPRFASTQRNHASRQVSTDFCNKICQQRKSPSHLLSRNGTRTRPNATSDQPCGFHAVNSSLTIVAYDELSICFSRC